jgi:hypothetical protein
MKLFKEIALKGLVRHLNQFLGGAVVATGAGTESDALIFTGVLMGLVSFGWSALRKFTRAQKEA